MVWTTVPSSHTRTDLTQGTESWDYYSSWWQAGYLSLNCGPDPIFFMSFFKETFQLMQFYTFLQLVKVILDYKQRFFASWKSKGLVPGSDQAIDPDPNWFEGESRSDEKHCSHRSRKKVSVIHRFIEGKTRRCTCLLFPEYQKMRTFFSIFCKLNPDPH